jgi:UDP-N-acetylmuramyl pentapeptide phosphotransferase/UDP-N-acetylglucosamine-1-phosphate transferase
MKFRFNVYVIVIFFLIIPSKAFAYLDPVTGLAIFQGVVAFIATIYATLILKPLKFLKKLFIKKNENQDKSKEQENKTTDKNKV